MASPLSDYFKSVGAKRLSRVDIMSSVSNQHEIGSNKFKEIFGSETVKFNGKFIFLSDDQEKIISDDGSFTWYDTRAGQAKRSAEYRLYYTSSEVISQADVQDLVVIGKTKDDNLVVIVSPKGSTSEKQLLWLFGLEEVGERFIVKDFAAEKTDIGFAGKYIISSLGFEIEETDPDFLDILVERYGKQFPSTKEFSEFSRSTLKDVSPIEEPDKTLMAWLEREELLFKTLEKEIVKEQLQRGFGKDGTDVDEFIKLSLSVHNRRKSRAGSSFENNLAFLFNLNNITYSHGGVTERNNKPDFIFPGTKQYHDPLFDTSLLTMLGVKTTAKDRWRQVLSEALKIHNKHLITLEPSISRNQTEDMRANNLQLVIPEPLLQTYHQDQKEHLITLQDFITLVRGKQNYT